VSGQTAAGPHLEGRLPSRPARASTPRPPGGHVRGHDEISPDEATRRAEEAAEDGCRAGERKVRHHPERVPGQSQVSRVGLHDGHRPIRESSAKGGRPPRVELHGDHASPAVEQRRGQRPAAGSDVENEVARRDAGLGDEAPGDGIIEVVPPPTCPVAGGHGTPSPWSSPDFRSIDQVVRAIYRRSPDRYLASIQARRGSGLSASMPYR
jgi:hypothetical protein